MKRRPDAGATVSRIDAAQIGCNVYSILHASLQTRPKTPAESLHRIQFFKRTMLAKPAEAPWLSPRQFGLGLDCSSDEFLWPGGGA